MKRGLLTIAAAMFLALALPIEPAMAQAPSSGSDPLTAARYSLVISGVEVAAFSTLDALESGGLVASSTQAPDAGIVKLHRGLTGGLEMWNWHSAGSKGRKDVTLVAYSTDGTPVMRFHLGMAWPSKIDVTGVKMGSSEAMVETVTLTCAHINRMNP
jgi:phage tail-like protein